MATTMTLRELKRYRRRVRQLEAVEEELSKYLVSDSVEGSKDAPSFEKTTRVIEGYPHTERVSQLLSQRQWLGACIQKIEDYIFSIDDEDERVCEALILYCIDERLYKKIAVKAKKRGKRSNSPVRVTWADVAEEMGASSGQAVKMMVYRYLDEHIAQ